VTNKEYLQQAYRLRRKIIVKREQIAALRSFAVSITAHTDSVRVDGSSNCGNRTNAIDKAVDLENLIQEDIDSFERLYSKIHRVIEAVDDDLCREILTLRYLCFKTWNEIAGILGYEERQIYRLHGKALERIIT
jgi:DNA-directed RNA polymerase specialized sigma subunit